MSEHPTSNSPSAPTGRTRRKIRIVEIGAVALAVLIAAAPWIMAHTKLLRDYAINAILASPSVTASSDRASFGWFSQVVQFAIQLKGSGLSTTGTCTQSREPTE